MTDDSMDLDGLDTNWFYPEEKAEETDLKSFINDSTNYFSSKFDPDSNTISMQKILLRGDAW